MQDYVKFAYNIFNNMGNEIDYEDVNDFLCDNKRLLGRNMKELKTMTNSVKALDYIREQSLNHRELSKELIIEVHKILMSGISAHCGEYRKHNVRQFACGVHDYKEIDSRLDTFIDLYNEIRITNSTSYLAAFVHAELIRIHPFNDGNGRVATLMMNFILLSSNLPAISIEPDDRELYMYFTGLYTRRHLLQPIIDMVEIYTRGGKLNVRS